MPISKLEKKHQLNLAQKENKINLNFPVLKQRVGQNASNYKNEENQINIENTNTFRPNNNDMIICKPNYMKAQLKNENVNQTTGSDLLNTNKRYQPNEWLTTNELGQNNNKRKTPKHKSVR